MGRLGRRETRRARLRNAHSTLQTMPKNTRYHPNGAIVWEGPSRINGEPIVLLVTGLFNPSRNPKTGPMHQTWILNRDVHPFEALKNGRDFCVCGDCPARFNPDTNTLVCYVNPVTTGQVWKSYQNNRYKPVTIDAHSNIWFDLKPLRIGAYGDPAAVPIHVWTDWLELLVPLKMQWTGYTRRWQHPENQPMKEFLMASTFSAAEQAQASALGWHTYRVLPAGADLPAQSTICPGSKEGNYAKTCRECLLCRGAAGTKDVVTYAHGHHAQHFQEV